ncbi:MAG: hypothetical protein AB1487_02260 [Thermodesulfobacteriota bacterium]
MRSIDLRFAQTNLTDKGYVIIEDSQDEADMRRKAAVCPVTGEETGDILIFGAKMS